jgi:hypothetical protein
VAPVATSVTSLLIRCSAQRISFQPRGGICVGDEASRLFGFSALEQPSSICLVFFIFLFRSWNKLRCSRLRRDPEKLFWRFCPLERNKTPLRPGV